MNADQGLVRRAELALFTAGVLYGASTPLGRSLGEWFLPSTIVALRFAFALPFCLIGLRGTSRRLELPAHRLLPVALLFPISATLFTYSFFEASIAVAIFGFYIANLLSSLLVGVLVHREPLDRPTVAAFASSIVAVALIALGQDGGEDSPWLLGFTLACGSGLAATAIANEQKRLADHVDGDTITLAQVVGGLVVCALFAFIIGDHSITQATLPALSLSLLYGALFFGCNRLMVYGFRKGAIGLGTVLLSIEVLVGPLMALAIFGESLSTLEVAGGAFTGLAVLMTAFRKPKPTTAEKLDTQAGAM